MDVSHAFSSTCKRRELFEAEDEIYRQCGEMITRVEARLRQTSRRQPAFRVRWLVFLWPWFFWLGCPADGLHFLLIMLDCKP